MSYQTRSVWTSEPNRAVAIKRRQVHLTWHFPGFGNASVRTATWDHARCLRQIKAWDRMHRARGSKAIEYNFFACPHGHVIEGRGDRQNAANGTRAANLPGQSCQVLVGDTEALTAGHLRAMVECATRLEHLHPGITRTQYGHRHWVSTTCPGSAVMAAIPVKPGSTVQTTPAPVQDPARPWLTSPRIAGLTTDQVRAIQSAVGVPADGKYGDATGTAVKALQTALDLTADGVWGPTTEETMTQLEAKIDALTKHIFTVHDSVLATPERILRATVERAGGRMGGTTSLAGMLAWNDDHTLQILEAIKATGQAAGVSDVQLQQITDAVSRVTAEQVASELTITTREE